MTCKGVVFIDGETILDALAHGARVKPDRNGSLWLHYENRPLRRVHPSTLRALGGNVTRNVIGVWSISARGKEAFVAAQGLRLWDLHDFDSKVR